MKRALRSGESAPTPLRKVARHPLVEVSSLKGLPAEALAVILAALRHEADRTGNPIYAWCAYYSARQNRLPIPEWVLAYFDGAAERLARLGSGRRTRDWRGAIVNALGFPRAALKLKHDYADLFLALESRLEDGLGRKGAEVVAEREGVSRAKVYRARTRA